MAAGVLILVAGPSGAGKDSLIAAARARLNAEAGFAFPKRFVTRADPTGEDHQPVSFEAFFRAQARGEFFLSWEAHGLGYAVPGSVRAELEAGRCVVVNVSRRVVETARALWPFTEVISVTVDPAVLRERLVARGRETRREIEMRVARASDPECRIAPPVHPLDNSGDLRESAAAFVSLLLALARREEARLSQSLEPR